MHHIIALLYDRSDNAEHARAEACYPELVTGFGEKGWVSYRTGVRINLDYTQIHSPIDGRIGRTSVTPGNMVTPTSDNRTRPGSAEVPSGNTRCRSIRSLSGSRGGGFKLVSAARRVLAMASMVLA
jgi:multidrug efflux pump subunit AcrA (membrane-fusion protein)